MERTSEAGGMSTFEDSTGALYSRDGRSTGWFGSLKDNYNTESLWKETIYRRSSWSSRIDAIGRSVGLGFGMVVAGIIM
jgi:hypothetical protein